MKESKYLIVGGSHAALSALDAIRLWDPEGPVTVLTQEERLPYSPTVLPYVVSGRAEPEGVFLRTGEAFARLGVSFEPGATVTGLDAAGHRVILGSGVEVKYEKLLLATGGSPALPPVKGLEDIPFHVLRTLDDAVGLRRACGQCKFAIVMGAGLIGMHAAESLSRGGVHVTVVEALGRVLPGYFDAEAAGLIEKVFGDQGIKILTGQEVRLAAGSEKGCTLGLGSGESLEGDLLIVATGVSPNMAFLQGAGLETDQGIMVDECMRSSAPDVWAAGDVAQAPGFFGPERGMNPTLTSAVEQGRIAGMDMAGDPALKPYTGRIPVNTFGFFDHRAFSVGLSTIEEGPGGDDGVEVTRVSVPNKIQYRKLVFREDRLVGAAGINTELDPGIFLQLIRKRIDLRDVKQVFIDDPLAAGRVLMTKMWR